MLYRSYPSVCREIVHLLEAKSKHRKKSEEVVFRIERVVRQLHVLWGHETGFDFASIVPVGSH